ncbi:hypothetical protein PHMEG_00038250 [Phytophthora megakarya]|uniref:RxLR effector protein n=1 Tax=Phytophthora megakarya TaxID=4795 RepID=A0A225UKJ3_9STRA|nr:hypothetical protein PHMEG_00038250 [Phytophthora megakarya]
MMRRRRTSTQSSEILQKTKNHQPLPKWAKVLIVGLSLGVTAGIAVGGYKTVDALTSNTLK